MSKQLNIAVGSMWDRGRFHMRDTHQLQALCYQGLLAAGHNVELVLGQPGKRVAQYDKTTQKWLTKTDFSEFDLVMGWGFTDRFQDLHENYLVGELGYFLERYDWVSLSWNGLNNYADFCNQDVPADRWEWHFKSEMQPWKTNGDYVLLAGQVPGDQSLKGQNMEPLYQDWVNQIKEKYSKPVRWRKHPLSPSNFVPAGADVSPNTSLDEDIAGAYAVCVYNSNTAVDAVMRGVPAICMDRGSMAWDVSTQGITDIVRPDRNDWGRKMGYTQWHYTELKTGKPFTHILKKFTEDNNE